MKFCWALLLLSALIISETVTAEENIENIDIVVPQASKVQDVETKVNPEMALPQNTEVDIDRKISREGRAVRGVHKYSNMKLLGRMVNNLDEGELEALERAIRTRERIRRRQSIPAASSKGKKRKSSKRKSNKNKKTKGSRKGGKRRTNSVGKRRKNNKGQKASINRKTRKPVRQQLYYDDGNIDYVNNDYENNDDVDNADVNNDSENNDNVNNNNNNVNNDKESVNNDKIQNDDVYEEEVHRFQRGDGEPISVMIIEEDLK